MSKTVAERTTPGQRQSVQENTYTAHCYSRVAPDSLSAVIVSDQEYPVRPAFTLLNKLLDDFIARVPRERWSAAADQARAAGHPRAEGVDFAQLPDYLQKYQDPRQADAIMRVQQELDETKIVLVRRWSSSCALSSDTFVAQDDRVGARARGEARLAGREEQRVVNSVVRRIDSSGLHP